MKSVRTHCFMLTVSSLAIALSLAGCEKKTETPAKPAAKGDGHTHKDGDGHDHGKTPAGKTAGKDDHGHGPTVQLGEQTVGGFTIKASRDGAIVPGKDAAIDVWVTGGDSKVSAVRFWIGTQDANGSVKAKGEIEKDNWHTHAEVPQPLPAGSKLWVEVETASGQKHTASFDLKS